MAGDVTNCGACGVACSTSHTTRACTAGVCSGGTCQSLGVVEYEQDFESLDRTDTDALSDDNWIVFGNVFDGTTMDYLYGYGAFPAPNVPAPRTLVKFRSFPEEGLWSPSVN